MHLPHIRDLPTGCRVCSPTRPGARRRPASTASSCTTRTPTRWRRSSRAPTRARTATAARARTACACRSRSSRACAARAQRLCRRLPLPRRRMHRRRQRACRRDLLRRRLRPGRHGLPVDLARRQVRRRQAARRRRGRLSVHRPQRLRVHAAVHLRRARAVRPQRRADRRDPAARSAPPALQRRSCAPAASTTSRWPSRC